MEQQVPLTVGRPLSNRIVVELLNELKDGMYRDCAALPSEVDLSARYGVSRSVIRDVLTNLEREGILERIKGVGSVVHRNVVNLTTRIDLKSEYNELIREKGCRPVTDSVKVYLEPASEAVAKRLQIPVGSDLIVCEKRLLADGRPVIYSIDRLPLTIFHDLPYARIDWRLPLFDILEEYHGVTIHMDVARLSPAVGSPAVRRMLRLGADEALIRIDEVGYYKLSHPIFHAYGYYTDFFEFAVLRKKF